MSSDCRGHYVEVECDCEPAEVVEATEAAAWAGASEAALRLIGYRFTQAEQETILRFIDIAEEWFEPAQKNARHHAKTLVERYAAARRAEAKP